MGYHRTLFRLLLVFECVLGKSAYDCPVSFKQWAITGLFFIYNQSFSSSNMTLKKINVKIYPSSIWSQTACGLFTYALEGTVKNIRVVTFALFQTFLISIWVSHFECKHREECYHSNILPNRWQYLPESLAPNRIIRSCQTFYVGMPALHPLDIDYIEAIASGRVGDAKASVTWCQNSNQLEENRN